MKRILPEQVVAKYKERGWRPTRHEFSEVDYNGVNCACGLGVIAGLTERQLREKRSSLRLLTDSEVISRELDLNEDYVDGYATGFDGEDIHPDDSEEEHVGYADGKAAWEAVVAAGLVDGWSEPI